MDILAAVAPNNLGQIRLKSEGYDPIIVDIADLAKRQEEENTSAAILRGTCKAYEDLGAKLQGLDIAMISNVPKGSGVSSSAAFEVLLGTILNELFMPQKVDAVKIAQIGQWVENVYFGKPCGLMDQMACSVGGAVAIDFADPQHPVVEQIDFDLHKFGHALCIIDSGADHADLTDEYAAIPGECKAVAKICGKEVLRQVEMTDFLENMAKCRKELGDRAVLRALHFFAENSRVPRQVQAIKDGDFDAFLALEKESCHSSWEYLQNITPAGYKEQQAVAVTIALARQLLGDRGAVRVHGGGFAGTVQAFVPLDVVADFKAGMEKVLGENTCNVMIIRPVGGVRMA
jgi:galactokinase